MKRRNLLKNLVIGSAAAMALPAWANNWSPDKLPLGTVLSPKSDVLLANIIDTLIPKTDTPGALELGVDKFVKALVDTMLSADEQKSFYEDQELNNFFKTLKNFSIQGYTGSEWYMIEKAGYEYAPGYGYGCVDVEQ